MLSKKELSTGQHKQKGQFQVAVILCFLLVGACANRLAPSTPDVADHGKVVYQIGAGDTLQIFVWRNPDLSSEVTVRPDGRISIPLVADLIAARRTPEELSSEIKDKLAVYVRDPIVTVIVTGFVGATDQQVRVIGAATVPRAIPFRADMSLLDVVIEVGGLTEFASGNNATLVRNVGEDIEEYGLRLEDLVSKGDISANIDMLPGDIIIIPETAF